MSPFLAWGDFYARSRFARSTIPGEKWGTTRSLARPKTGPGPPDLKFEVLTTRPLRPAGKEAVRATKCHLLNE